MKRAVAAALLLLFACRGEQPPQPREKKQIIIPPPSDNAERGSLANLAYGATIASRTGEAILETSAIAAIDGDPVTYWLNPPKDFPQSLTIELAAPTRIDRVGLRTPEKPQFRAKEIAFETSMDGRAFQPLATVPGNKLWLGVNPTDAAFLRVTVAAPGVENGNVMLYSVLAHGRELAPAHPGAIDGKWRVNGRDAEFFSRGGRTSGHMQYARSLLLFDGGSNGRFWRFEWIRGPEFGYAAIAVSPGGRRLSGVQWHEEVIPLFFGDAWFGERADVQPIFDTGVDVGREFLRRTGRHSLFALHFAPNGTLDAAASADQLKWLVEAIKQQPHPRLVAHEFREKTSEANRARAQRALDSLAKAIQNAGVEPHRVTLVAAGSDHPRQIPGSEAARELYSSIDLEAGR